MVTFELRADIEDFLHREARLLDEHRFEDWWNLFTDDAEYIVPLREHVQGDVGPAGHPIIRDNKMMLLARSKKDQTGLSHVEIPSSMTCHLISNVIVDETQSSYEVQVSSSFIVRQARKLRDEAWWVGRRQDILRQVGDSWMIARREVNLDMTVLPRGISIFF